MVATGPSAQPLAQTKLRNGSENVRKPCDPLACQTSQIHSRFFCSKQDIYTYTHNYIYIYIDTFRQRRTLLDPKRPKIDAVGIRIAVAKSPRGACRCFLSGPLKHFEGYTIKQRSSKRYANIDSRGTKIDRSWDKASPKSTKTIAKSAPNGILEKNDSRGSLGGVREMIFEAFWHHLPDFDSHFPHGLGLKYGCFFL